ncbi:L-threonylcarbamoyladenylate synthase [Parenemella sanctibonifatiensis]|uniref:Threonylcarbamoyl-AMP synthase n=1 Tax=Parenemella sanctibonifatiensis TaxID=2016505 RepID=A0A255E486_9ACTN|nr:L-threonylcarbamoyladenylate synthase [Parenemella sanctibonifatiensis]OYN86378.1 threonylcarbamoyl-AMP synthase [Parenemella sanctibonifatiensis]
MPYYEVHPEHPQPRSIGKVADIVRDGGLIGYPTDSAYALGCRLGNKEGLDRIKRIRKLNDKHHFTLVCSEFAQLGTYVHMDNATFRLVKSLTPGAYTFILAATREVPRAMQHPKKKTVGVRIPPHVTTLALLDAIGEPLVSSTLILPDADAPLTDGWQVNEEIGHELDAVIDSGDAGNDPTTVVDLTGDAPEVVRVGAGDIEPFS